MPILEDKDLRAVRTAMTNGGIGLTQRADQLYLINPVIAASLPIRDNAYDQIFSDLRNLNTYTNMPDGSIPLLTYLENSVDKLFGKPEAEVLQDMVEKVSGFTLSSAHPVNLQAKDAKNEVAIHRDDMLDFGFLGQGYRAGASVAKILVNGFENGNPLLTDNGTQQVGAGTCWLLTPDLILTNHHVINNRLQDDVIVADKDFTLQAQNSTAQFDYDYQNANIQSVQVQELICADRALDYALLRLSAKLPRAPLPIHNRIVSPPPGEYLPVNIIQHPNGNPKRVAVRNNLVNSSSAELLTYFTDTLRGSSGSPVFNDTWKVVALHRGWQPVVNINFQGKDTAYVNYGTQILKILAHIKQSAPTAWDEVHKAHPDLDGI